MAPRVDLTGASTQGWTVLQKAAAQNRVPFWTATHDACGIVTDLPHVTLKKAFDGGGTLPACTACVPAVVRRNIDHGMHLACGQAHLIGTPCPDGIQREPGPSTVGRMPATTHDYPAYTAPVEGDPFWKTFDEVEDAPAPVAYTGHPADALPESAYQQAATPIEPASHLADAETGAVVTHGRVDRLEEPQAILDVIRQAMHGRARNHQSQPGPSQIGGCERRLGHHLAFGQGNGARDDGAWRPEVGTAVHAWLDAMFAAVPYGIEGDTEDGPARRWLSDVAVTAPVAGRLDLFDVVRREVIDFKVSGKATRDKAARGEISDKYEMQLDLYGLGMMHAGYRVERVALLFLPAAGSLDEAVWYSRPFSIERAMAGVARLGRIAAMLSVAEPERVLAQLSTTEDYCASCAALGPHCKGADTAWIPGGLPDSAWPAYDAAVKASGGAA